MVRDKGRRGPAGVILRDTRQGDPACLTCTPHTCGREARVGIEEGRGRRRTYLPEHLGVPSRIRGVRRLSHRHLRESPGDARSLPRCEGDPETSWVGRRPRTNGVTTWHATPFSKIPSVSCAVTKVEEFFEMDDPRHKLPIMVRQAVVLGNGGGDVAMRGGEVVGTRIIDFESIRMFMTDGVIEYTQDRRYIAHDTYHATPEMKRIPLRSENLIHLRLKEWPRSPYGMSLFRPNILLFSALDQSSKDIPAALKEWSLKFKNVHSATSNIVTDSRHDIGVVGSLGGGGGGANLLPVMALLTPIISVVLMNFGFALGYFLQQGATRAILEEEKELSSHMIARVRGQIAHDLRRTLLTKIADSDVDIVFDMDDRDWERRSGSLLRPYERGLVSKEFLTDMLDIVDAGTTVFDPIAAKTPKLQLPAPTSATKESL